jgi:hypothetical protein
LPLRGTGCAPYSADVGPQKSTVSNKVQTMTPPTINCARAVRDGGIDAMAALNAAVSEALAHVAKEHEQELKRAFGRLMGEVIEELINPAISAFPELELDEAAWVAIAKARAEARSNAG